MSRVIRDDEKHVSSVEVYVLIDGKRCAVEVKKSALKNILTAEGWASINPQAEEESA